MRNYAREFEKFSVRKVRSDFPITAIRMNKILCQDVLFDLNNKYTAVGSVKFSSAFFYDFYKIATAVDWNTVYVIDGVKFLHEHTGTDKPLVKDRALYKFLYLTEDSSAFYAEALATNPWLNDLCNRPTRLLSDRVLSVRSTISQLINKEIYGTAITDGVSSEFTPRGVWGYDYMFRWKQPRVAAEVYLTERITMVSLQQYIESFEEVTEYAITR